MEDFKSWLIPVLLAVIAYLLGKFIDNFNDKFKLFNEKYAEYQKHNDKKIEEVVDQMKAIHEGFKMYMEEIHPLKERVSVVESKVHNLEKNSDE